MKNYTFYSLLYILLLSAISCTDDKDKIGIDPDQSVNEWIYETMEENYLWNTEIPATSQVNFSADPEDFFISLLSSNDGKEGYYYSTIESKSSSTKSYHGDGLTLGFEYQAYYTDNQRTKIQLKILYILPNSPAANSDLQRGEWVHTINNQTIPTTMDISSTLYSGTEVTLGIGDVEGEELRSIKLTAQMVEDHPVFLDTIYSIQNRQIGYLVYNHFTSDPDNNGYGDGFDQDLKAAFAGFKNANLNDFILDLRYNNGGLVSCAQLLGTMLAPAEALGDIFCQMIYNQDQQNKNSSLPFDQSLSGYNIDTKRLYVLTSSRTASASEAVINGLKPFLGNNLILVGTQTEGKNVGSVTYTDDRFEWELHPIVCYISNKNPLEEADYSEGFSPYVPLSEPNSSLYELGDTREYMLATVLNLLAGSGANFRSESIEKELIPAYSSLDQKTNRGMLLPGQ
ncbi:MAG: S41 family peptidase [Firmicutes bacterium]|nr:S41 family peptidase [Bacillota bacterium]